MRRRSSTGAVRRGRRATRSFTRKARAAVGWSTGSGLRATASSSIRSAPTPLRWIPSRYFANWLVCSPRFPTYATTRSCQMWSASPYRALIRLVGSPRRRRPSTPTATCGRTVTTPHVPPLRLSAGSDQELLVARLESDSLAGRRPPALDADRCSDESSSAVDSRSSGSPAVFLRYLARFRSTIRASDAASLQVRVPYRVLRRLRRRSRARTHAGAGAGGSGRSRGCACSRPTSGSGRG